MAFQIVDDILDVVASDEELGKPSGHDLVEGTYTLPVLRALAGPDGQPLRDLLGKPLTDAERIAARELVRSNGAIPLAVDAARYHADRAVAALGDAASTEAGAWLAATTEALVDKVALRSRV